MAKTRLYLKNGKIEVCAFPTEDSVKNIFARWHFGYRPDAKRIEFFRDDGSLLGAIENHEEVEA